MRKSNITIYDLNMRKLALLENAITINYETPMNGLWTAGFELPLDDEKNEYCQPFYFVELFDLDGRMDLYRILPNTAKRDGSNQTVSYSCEHVLATLIDDVLFQFHKAGNLGVYTAQSIQYVLDQQTTQHWVLGQVDFERQFEYSWENTNLYSALISIPRPIDEVHMWTWDTTSYPWILNLIRPSDHVQAIIRYGHNMSGITREVNPTELVNRVYGLGYGEGVNQLTFAEVNNGVPYIEDAESIAKYGLKQQVWADRRFTSAETLIARARTILAESSVPRVTYTVDASELYAITGDRNDKFRTGDVVRVQDPDMGKLDIRIVNVKKGDIFGDRGKVQLEIANKSQDITTSMSDINNRLRIEEVYAQGATNVNVYNLAENCDPTHPAKFKIWIPDEAVRINKILLTYENEPFRANSKAVSGGGAITTSTEAGGATVASSYTDSRFDDYNYTTEGMTPSAATLSAGSHLHNVDVSDDGGHFHTVQGGSTSYDGVHNHPLTQTDSDGEHIHFLDKHDHYQTLIPHFHDIQLPNHVHAIDLPNHEHEIEFGIYEGATATKVKVEIDGVETSITEPSATTIDLINYLDVDEEGKIKRGQYHEIEITPNDFSRIVASVVIQFFVNSRGGGVY
ncbi:phage tail spike protein [Paenibacillus yanchengensis]|uniref:Phage tail spike protein n=1 Tax=Paenibacillus yanchengensis TaxID=2035833 RepID=A0ABW4YR01_9BACL